MSQATPVAKQVLVLGASSEAARAVKELLALGYKVLWVSGDGLPSNGLDSPALAKYANCRLYHLKGMWGVSSLIFSIKGKGLPFPPRLS